MHEQYELPTPENVLIRYELAGVGSRFVAALLDSLITGAAALGIFIALALGAAILSLPQSAFGWAGALGLLLAFVITFGYGLFFEIVWSGQTPGKRLAGIRAICQNGSPITATAAVVRNVLRLVDFLPAYYIIGILVMLFDRRARRLGDLAAGTIVVKERRDLAGTRLTLAVPGSLGDEASPVTGDFRRLSYDDYHLIKEYLLRREQLAPAPAHDLAVRIAQMIAAKLGVETGGESAEEFLARVGAELERQRWR